MVLVCNDILYIVNILDINKIHVIHDTHDPHNTQDIHNIYYYGGPGMTSVFLTHHQSPEHKRNINLVI